MLSRDTRQDGFTLVETMVGIVLMSGVLGGIFASLDTGVDTMRVSTSWNAVETEANRALIRVIGELAGAGLDSLLPVAQAPESSSSLTFRRNTGFVNGAIEWGPESTIAWDPDPDDPADGVDNDGDGLVDEGRIVQRVAPGTPLEETFVWFRDVARYLDGETPNGLDDNGNGLVDEAGLAFSVDGGTVNVYVTVTRRGYEGRMITRTAQSAIRLKN